MKIKRPSPAMVVAVIALVMSMTGGAIAAVNYAKNAGAVDGKSAVKASSSNHKAASKLVAMNGSGKLPFKFLDGAASDAALKNVSAAATRGRNGVQLIQVLDNSQTVATDLVDLDLGKLQVTCLDEQDKPGIENATTRLTVTNASGAPLNISRRVGTAIPEIQTFEANEVDTFAVGTQNTFTIQLQAGTKSVLVEGTARQVGQGTADSACAVFATALFVGFQ